MTQSEENQSSSARERFLSLAETRTRKTIKDIRLIGNLSNRSNYSYDANDVAKIFRALEHELKAARQKFEASRGASKGVDFSLR